jgi:hypothetical protein
MTRESCKIEFIDPDMKELISVLLACLVYVKYEVDLEHFFQNGDVTIRICDLIDHINQNEGIKICDIVTLLDEDMFSFLMDTLLFYSCSVQFDDESDHCSKIQTLLRASKKAKYEIIT